MWTSGREGGEDGAGGGGQVRSGQVGSGARSVVSQCDSPRGGASLGAELTSASRVCVCLSVCVCVCAIVCLSVYVCDGGRPAEPGVSKSDGTGRPAAAAAARREGTARATDRQTEGGRREGQIQTETTFSRRVQQAAAVAGQPPHNATQRPTENVYNSHTF